ncbi:PREDICTED: probable E3 ubiquitin-protein ligase ARI13 [Camelina sativa]|uniref:RBR-type E3 ubiquitin transferase n=1 Tax=Camelina sativa TaxID=90675 RepID=A0ABM1QLQ1_CAMSA|nr:PREDICTED: probable E3 ubiquitin-protein ligase ARI13 [Camelina sativa]
MEKDQKSPYHVLTKDEVREKMKKQIDDISGVFSISESDAIVLLKYHRWDSMKVSDCLVENKEKALLESGLRSVVPDPNGELSLVLCLFCFKTPSEFDGDLVSTPFCSHNFCTACWNNHLKRFFYPAEKNNQTAISCPHPACRAAVGPDTIEKLPVPDQDMYKKYILKSYREGNKVLDIKKCPARDCRYLIAFQKENNDDGEEDCSLNVVCLCGHIFCWRCMLESHRPVTCNNASDWLYKDLKILSKVSDESSKLSSIPARKNVVLSPSSIRRTITKTCCPHCLRSENMHGKQYSLFVTCTCGGRYYWRCMQSEKDHKEASGLYKLCNVQRTVEREAEVKDSCVEHWKACGVLVEKAKSDLKDFEESIIEKPSDLTEKDITIIRKGLMLVRQCRQVIQWSCVYDYYHAEYETSKREYLRFLQANATSLVDSFANTLKEEKERGLSDTSQEFCCVKHKVSVETTDLGNHFYHFIKTLQEGLDDVKVKAYDNYGGLFWFCDRCTYGNTWFHKKCQVCCDDTAAPPELSDLSMGDVMK